MPILPTPPLLPSRPWSTAADMAHPIAESSLVDLAVSAGASGAVLIQPEQIVLSDSFRAICQGNQCGNFGKCWVCPPMLPPIEEAMARIRSFTGALWYQSVWPLEDSFDIEGMFEAGHRHALLSQRIQETVSGLLSGPVLHLTCGGCHLCPVCAKREEKPCRMPDKALASLEGYGVDVYSTTKGTTLPYIHGPNTVTYFGMVLFST